MNLFLLQYNEREAGFSFVLPGGLRVLIFLAGSLNQEFMMNKTIPEEKGLYWNIFESAADGLIIADLETGRVVRANPAACAMQGYTCAEFIGMLPAAFIHPDSQHIFSNYPAGVPIRQLCSTPTCCTYAGMAARFTPNGAGRHSLTRTGRACWAWSGM